MSWDRTSLTPVLESRRWDRLDSIACVLIALVTVVVLGKDISVGGFRYGDASVHAMDGVLIHDWIAAGPSAWLRPMAFAIEQYGHYPSLGIGRHYPPGFAMVEAFFFAVFGVSAFSARLCVVFFGLLATTGVYVLVRPWADRLTAGLSATIFLALPATVEWGRQTMLELPTMAALTWTAVAFSWFLHRPSWWRCAVMIALAAAAPLFKQTAVFLICAVALTLVIEAIRGRIRVRAAVLAGLAATATLVAVTLSLDGHGRQLLSGDRTFHSRFDPGAMLFYLRALPTQVGWICLAMAGAGLIFHRRSITRLWPFLAAWFGLALLMLTAADYKNTRYLFIALLPVAVSAAAAGSSWIRKVIPPRLAVPTMGICGLALCVVAFLRPTDIRPGYDAVVIANRERIMDRAVLFSGLTDGDFVFAVRQHIPWRRAIVVRASKVLYSCNARPELDFESYASTMEDVKASISRFGFRHLFVEQQDRLGLLEEKHLRDYLETGGDYRRVSEFHLALGPRPSRKDIDLGVYEATGNQAATIDHYDIPIARTGGTVRVSLRALEAKESGSPR